MDFIPLPSNIKNKVVLIAALDWGMGHTTRCVALIQKLLEGGNKIVFAGNKQQITFIKTEFPVVETELLEGYDIWLDSTKNTYAQLSKQLLKVNQRMRAEKKWLDDFLNRKKVDIVISDNRYGFYSETTSSILLTHQLTLQVPLFKGRVNRKLDKWLSKFSCCWVPDFPDQKLTGELSDHRLNIPVHFIGILNRFESVVREPVIREFLVVLSGPEPERTNFLTQAIEWAKKTNRKVAFVGAIVTGYESFPNPSSSELAVLIHSSNCIVSRAGYTTVMEMAGLRKKAILIPTKGQYEQEYLAKFIKRDHIEFRDQL